MAVDVSALDGFFKVRYADKMENLVPAFAKVAKIIPFKTGEKTGSTYQFPVRLRRSMGITWAGGADYGTAFALNSPVSGVLKNATLTGTEFVLTEYLSYGAISKATSTIEATRKICRASGIRISVSLTRILRPSQIAASVVIRRP